MACPNCLDVHDAPVDVCIIAALASVLESRSELSPEEALARVQHANQDALWLDLGRILDRLEDGAYGEPVT